jgi:tripartite-type tricarboxylate transporter receptor subunit TctC
MIGRRSLLGAAAGAPLLARAATAALLPLLLPGTAQAFPDRPVMMIVPYAPGGSADVLARVLAPAMSKQLGQPVVVELRAGAGGNIGATHVAVTLPADGYALLFASISLATSVAVGTLPFDPLRDLVAVAGVGAVPSLLVVSPRSPYRDLRALLAAARERPGRLSYGSSGLATASHLSGELLAAQAGVQMLHVPYRGSGAVYPDLIAGRIDFLLDAMGSSAGQVRQGAVRAIGITSPVRVEAFPDVPTLAEQGVPGFEFNTWLGFFARTGAPPEALRRLEAAALAALQAPAVRERLAQAAAIPIPGPGAEFAGYYHADVERWTALARSGHLQRAE